MKILALDTATEACSAALLVDGVLHDDFRLAPRKHTELILSMAQVLLADAGLSVQQLDAIAFGRGPGSFTGVRIATGVAQGLAFAADLPVAPISTLAAIAHQATQESSHSKVLATLDARMGGVYWGCYERNSDDNVVLIGSEQVSAPEAIVCPDDFAGLVAGSAVTPYGAQISLQFPALEIVRDVLPAASSMALLAASEVTAGKLVDAHQALPVYLRNDVAKKTVERQA